MSIKNARTLGIRLDEKRNAQLATIERETHLDGVSIARAALYAVLEYYETHRSITIPMKVVPQSTTAGVAPKPTSVGLNEAQQPYTARSSDNDLVAIPVRMSSEDMKLHPKNRGKK